MKNRIWVSVCAFLLLLSGGLAQADVQSGLQWLAATAQSDGSFTSGNSISNPFQSTAETLRTLNASGTSSGILVTGALQSLSTESYFNTENLSRLIIAGSNNGQDVSAPLAALLANQDLASGGFGELPGYQPTVLDTAFALEALAVSGNTGLQAVGYTVGFLQQQQGPDGSWSDGGNGDSVYLSALSVVALHGYTSLYGLAGPLQAGSNYLLSARQSDGLWGEDFLSGESLIALLQTLSDRTTLQAGVQNLLAHQGGDGSWGGDDVFTSAVVLRALGQAQAAGSGNAATGAIQGYVLLAGSSQPLAGVAVSIPSIPGLTVLTNSAGYFTIGTLPAGGLTVVASKPGYSSSSAAAAVVAGQTAAVNGLVLAPGNQSGTLLVHLVDATSGASLAGATVNVTGPTGSGSATSDNNGNAEFDALAPGSYGIAVQNAGYQSASATVMLSGAQILTFSQPLLSTTAVGSGSTGLTGTVVDAASAAPLSGASVAIGSNVVTTDASGHFTVSGLSGSSYTATVGATGYATQVLTLTLPGGVVSNLGTISLYGATGSSTPTTLTLVATVIDALSNKPISGATATVVGTSLTATSDANGQMTLSGIPALSFQIQFSASGYTSLSYTVTASAFGSVAGTFALPPASAGGSAINVSGKVTDSSSGTGIAGASLQVVGASVSATSDASGNFQLSNLQSQQFQVLATAPGYQPQTFSASLNGPGNYTLNVQLSTNAGAGASSFRILTLSTGDAGKGANQTQVFNTQVANVTSVSAEGIVIGYILDGSGKQVAKVTPNLPGSSTQQSDFSFAPNEVKTLQVAWNPVQSAPGAYTLQLDVVQPGSITRDNPGGTVEAQSSAFTNVTASSAIVGTLAFNPPSAQAGASAPVDLSVLVVNAGNVALNGTPLTLTITDPSSGTVVYTAQAQSPQLPVGNFEYLSFGSWVPTASGNLTVAVSSTGDVQGQIAGTFYVGDKPQGTFAVTPSTVFTGNQAVQGTIDVTGVDKSISVDSPLVFAIQQAVTKGSNYVAPNAIADQESTRCLRCHVQSESYYGLASLVNNNIGSNAAAVQYLNNAFGSSQQASGSLNNAYSGYVLSQSVLASWALSQTPDKLGSFATKYKEASYLQSRISTNGNQSYWYPDYWTGWWASVDGYDMLGVTGMVDVLLTAQNNDVSRIVDYGTAGLASFGGYSTGLKTGPDGNLYTVDYNAGAVIRFNLASKTREVLATGLPGGCNAMVPLSTSEFMVSCPGQLLHVQPDGSIHSVAALNSQWNGDTVVDASGNVYVADRANNRILVGPPAGPFTVYASGGLLNQPIGLAFAADGSLYVSNSGGYNILKFATDGSSSVFSNGLAYPPRWLNLQADGTLYVAAYDYTDGTSGMTTPGGLMHIDSQGNARRVVEVSALDGIAYLNGTLYLTDANANVRTLTTGVLDTSQLPAMRTTIANVANYAMAQAQSSPDIFQLITLGEARKVITDPNQLAQIDQAISSLATTMRSRQKSDGGWWWSNSGQPSDALATALVGLGLEYTNPQPDDPALLNAVQFLLNTQQGDGSWSSADGVMSTDFATTGLVMAFLPRVLDELGGINVELHLTTPANVTLSNPSLPPAGNLPNGDGTTSYTWALPGVTSAGQVINFNLALANMQTNETRAVASSAFMLSTNSFDGSQLQVNLPIPQVHAADGLSLVSAQTDQASYTANGNAAFTAQVTNIAPAMQSGTVVYTIKAADGSIVATLSPVTFSNLASNGTTGVSAGWSTGSTLAGNYTLVADLYDTSGAKADEKTTGFAIIDSSSGSGTSSVTLRVSTDKPAYNTTDTVNIGDLVQDLSVNSVVDSATLQVTVTDPTGAVVYSPSSLLGQLTPGFLRTIGNTLALKAATIGTYAVNGKVIDGSGSVLASGTASFTVAQSLSAALTGSEAVANASIYQGDAQACTDGITDRGTQAVSNLPLQQLVVNLDANTVDQTTAATISLAAGATQGLQRNVASAGLAVGNHACVIQAQVNGNWQVLASAPFTVKAPVVKVTGSETVQSATVNQGDTELCTDVVTNAGTGTLTNLPIQQLVINTDTGTTDQQASTTATLAPGASQNLVRTFSTSALAVGHHACVVDAQVNGAWQQIGSAAFTVNPPPLKVEGQMGPGLQSRLLVLMDGSNGCGGGSTLCKTGLHDLYLQNAFGKSVPATASVQVTLYNSSGKTIDTETSTVGTFTGTVDATKGSPADLAITGLTANGITLHLSEAQANAGFDGTYRIVVKVSASGMSTLTFDSSYVNLSCSYVSTIGSTVGHYFTVTAFNTAQSAGGSTTPQQAYLQSLLNLDGWSYTISTSTSDFTTKLRSGGYGAYAIYTQSQTLQQQVEKEIRELVNDGEGLYVAGAADCTLETILGVDDFGQQQCPVGVQMLSSNAYSVFGQSSFTQHKPVQMIQLMGAITDGNVMVSGKTSYPALVTHYVYGNGKAAYAGFDLLDEAYAGNSTTSLYAQLIRMPQLYVNPPQLPVLAGRVVPVHLTVTNDGAANTTAVSVSTSAGGYVVAGNIGTAASGKLTASLTLAAGQSQGIDLWVQLPAAGPLTVTATLTASANGKSATPVNVTYAIQPTSPPGLSKAITDLTSYVNQQGKSCSSAAKQALTLLNQANSALNSGNVSTALSDLVQATDQLIQDGSAGIRPIRLEVDEAIYEVEKLQ